MTACRWLWFVFHKVYSAEKSVILSRYAGGGRILSRLKQWNLTLNWEGKKKGFDELLVVFYLLTFFIHSPIPKFYVLNRLLLFSNIFIIILKIFNISNYIYCSNNNFFFVMK